MDETVDYPEARLKEAQALLTLSNDELFARIAAERPSRGFGNPKQRYEVIIRRCQGAICSDKRIRILCTSRNTDKITHLVCAIADTVMHTMGVPVPAMTIAAIAINSGLELLCKEQWHA